jgi:putative FmdB family regulatory protein
VPTYQYQCTDCGEGLEAVQKFTDEALTECPGCEGRLRKVFSAVGVVFKGSGFYRTDSRAPSSGSSGSAAKSSSSSDSPSSTASTPAKSDGGSSASSSSSAASSSASSSQSTSGSSAA